MGWSHEMRYGTKSDDYVLVYVLALSFVFPFVRVIYNHSSIIALHG